MTTLCLCDFMGCDDEAELEARLRAEYAALKGDGNVVYTVPQETPRRMEAPAWTR